MRSLTIAAGLLISSSVLAQTTPPNAPAPDMISDATPKAASIEASVPTGADTPTLTEEKDAAAAVSIGSGAMSSDPQPDRPTVAPKSPTAATGDALSPLEFAMYASARDSSATTQAKRERYDRAAGNGAIRLLNDTAAEFSKADKNMDRRIDAAELAAWNAASASSAAVPVSSGAGVMASPTVDMTTAAQPDASGAPADATDAPDGQMGDDTMATDTPPKK